MTGGHSGVEIQKQGANANVVLGRVLYELKKKADFTVVSVDGGLKDNAITRSARAILMFAPGQEDLFMDILKEQQGIIEKEYHKTDAGMSMTDVCGNAVITALRTFPWGVQKMSKDMEGLVQTSLNPGILETKADTVSLVFSVRSSVASEKEELYDRLVCLTESLGGKVSRSGDNPCWC